MPVQICPRCKRVNPELAVYCYNDGYELRAATDLAHLWRHTRPDKDLRALLQPILAKIEGGETALDVRKARSLLDGRG